MQAKRMRRLCLEVLAGMSEVAHVVGEAGTGQSRRKIRRAREQVLGEIGLQVCLFSDNDVK